MKPVSMKMIAEKAGVSRPTVSEILSNNPKKSGTVRISDATRERVLKIVKELNYRPNYLAQALKARKTNLIGVTTMGGVLIQFNEPYISEVYEGIGNHLYSTHYKLVFQNFSELTDTDPLRELVAGRLVDGVIFLIFSNEIEEFRRDKLPAVKQTGIPFVVIHSIQEDLGVPATGVDCVHGGYMGTKHLLEHGYKTIGFVNYRGVFLHGQNLYKGYTQALHEYSVPLNSDQVYGVEGVSYSDGYQLASSLVEQRAALPRAFFVVEEKIAFGMIKKFTEAGVRVPDDVAVVGFGNIRSDALELSGLTAITQPAGQKGQLAAEMLVRMIEQPETQKELGLKLLIPELVIRTSCGCGKA